MDRTRVSAALPYLLLLAAAVYFYMLADGIEYSARPGSLGPDFWPKAAILLIAVVSVYEIVKAMFFDPGREAQGIAASLGDAEEQAAEAEAPRYPWLLAAGAALTLAYGLLIPYLGFPLATFLFFVCFIYIGRYRSHLAIWLSALIGTAVFSILFLKVVYVSLPRGVPPFDRLSDAIINLF